MNDYENTLNDCTDARHTTETALENAQDDNIVYLLTLAIEKIDEAAKLAEEGR